MALLLASTPGSADWLQAGYDAARTSVTPEDGPEWPDTVYRFLLPALGPSRWTQAEPVVVGDTAFVAGESSDGLATIFAVDLPTGTWVPFASPRIHDPLGDPMSPARVKQLATDGERLFALVEHGQVDAWTLDNGSPAWPSLDLRSTPFVPSTQTYPVCQASALAVSDAHLYLACNMGPHTFHAWRIEAATGRLDWSYDWASDPRMAEDPPVDTATLVVNSPRILSEAGEYNEPTGITVLSETVLVTVQVKSILHLATTAAGAVTQHFHQPLLVALELRPGGQTGKALWTTAGQSYPLETEGVPNWIPAATGAADVAFFERGGELWSIPLTAENSDNRAWVPFRPRPLEGDPGSGLALAPEGLYATTLDQIVLLDAGLGTIASHTLPTGTQWGRGSPVRTGNGLIIARTGPIDGTADAWLAPHGGLQTLEARTLRPVWAVSGAVNCTFAVSDGIVIRWCQDGMFEVLGRGEASIPIAALTTSRYPAPGEGVRVDLGATGAGAFGSPTEYRAVWGDGTETEWQERPVFEHRYTQPTDMHARFYARNANQSSSLPVVFHVGTADPSINIFNSPFSDQYQEATFFFLGLLITAILAMVGLYRAGRKRRLLERELRSLQALKEEYGDDDEGLQARLVERRQRAHDLYMDRKLEDGHLQVLERRIDELTGRARLGRIEEECSFLPVGLARSLEEMLRDGRISSRERATFLAAVDEHHALRAGEKAKIRRLIDEWFQHDSGGKA